MNSAVSLRHAKIALLSGKAIPLRRLSIILRNAVAAVVHDPEVELGVGITLISKGLPFTQRGL